MGNYFMGNGRRLQIGPESTYGTAATMTDTINITNESITLEIETGEEESLLGGKASSGKDVMGRKGGGDIAVSLKPDNNKLFAFAFGKEAANPVLVDGTTGVYKHTLTLVPSSETLKSFTVTVDRGAAIKAYKGCKISSCKLDFKNGSYITGSFGIVAQDEAAGTLNSGLPNPSIKAYKYTGGNCKIDSVDFNDITDASFDLNNDMFTPSATLASGMVKPEGNVGKREVKTDFTCFYNAASEALRENKFKEGVYVELEYRFESPAEIETGENYRFEIVFPNLFLEKVDANVSGKDIIECKVSGSGMEIGSEEPVIMYLYDNKSTKYF